MGWSHNTEKLEGPAELAMWTKRCATAQDMYVSIYAHNNYMY